MKIFIRWMDGESANFEADSARVWDSVLVLHNAHREDLPETWNGKFARRVNFPVANIRSWMTDE